MHMSNHELARVGACCVFLLSFPPCTFGYYVYIIHSFYFTCAGSDAREMIKQMKKEMV